MSILTTKQYEQSLRIYEQVKQPLLVLGGFGIGKSEIPRQVFRSLAAEQDLQFEEWSDLTIEEKRECIANPEKYYIFFDARTSQMDTTSLQGIPNMNKTEQLENIPYSWAVYFTQEKANGAIFFDEINLAAPIVQSITYSVINDRVISDRRLGDNVYVFAAGNRQKDRGHTYEMAQPLRDRFAEIELEVNVSEWIEWARANQVNPHLVSFIDWKGSWLNKVDEDVKLKPSTPRGVVRASKLMNKFDMNKSSDIPIIHQLVSSAVGESFAMEFQAYTKAYSQLNWEEIFENPESIGEMKIDLQHAVAGGLIDKFAQATQNADKVDADHLKQLLEIALHDKGLKKGLTIHVLMSMKDINRDIFSKAIQQSGLGRDIASKIGKFLV